MQSSREIVQANALVASQGFSTTEMQNVVEASAQAIAARERALVESRFVMALQRPRNMENVNIKLKQACQKWTFADEAWYSRPAGREKNEQTGEWEEKMAEGFSIRFAEEAGRTMGNMMSDSQIVSETPEERVVHVWAMDLETNFTRGISISVPKQIERQKPKDGQIIIAERKNSRNQTVYIVQANRNELNTTQANLVAKAERQCILKMLPAWVLRECKEQIQETLAKEIQKDPDAAKRKLLEAFGELKIMPTDLQAYIGHTIDRLTEKEIAELRNVYRAVKQGEISWDELMESRGVTGSPEAQQDVAKRKILDLQKKATEQKPAAPEAEKPVAQTVVETKPVVVADEADDSERITDDQVMTLLTWMADKGLPEASLKAMLAKYGADAPKDVKVEDYPKLREDVFGWTPAVPAAAAAPAAQKLQFGKGKK